MVVITTFSQSVFRTAVPVKVVYYQTRNIPVYYFIAGAFAAGLLIGMSVAFYNFISLKAQAMKKDRRIRELENNMASVSRENLKVEANVKNDETPTASGPA
jgi:uncharacterized membrane protein YciS (DUF1049 family)